MAFGLAAVEAIDLVLRAGAASLKWPNDVMVAGHKVGGLLTQAAPSGELVIGLGLNVHQRSSELGQIRPDGPPPGSLASLGAPDLDRDWLAIAYLAAAARLYQCWDQASAGLVDLVSQRLGTLGQPIQVRQPDGTEISGQATQLAADGALEVVTPDGRTVSVVTGQISSPPATTRGPADDAQLGGLPKVG
jgi:BirA family biotin operon repressor/biotin-[acetyl-CoA-carboxylase] ligase